MLSDERRDLEGETFIYSLCFNPIFDLNWNKDDSGQTNDLFDDIMSDYTS